MIRYVTSAVLLLVALGCVNEPCEDTVSLISGFQILDDGITNLESVGDKVVLTVDGNLWGSDGTFDGTVTLPCTGVSPDEEPVRTSERLFVLCNEGLVSTDGTVAGTEVLAGAGGDATLFGDELWFRGGGSAQHLELWRSDGTVAGTHVAGGLSAAGGSDPRELTVGLGVLFYSADDGKHGRELWRTDGTLEGTGMVVDLVKGEVGSDPRSLAAAQTRLFFLTADGRLVWTAGTEESTYVVTQGELDPETELTASGGSVFYANEGHLWTTDGMIAPVDLGLFEVGETAAANGFFFFIAPLEGGGSAIWRTDGTREATRPVVNPRAARAHVKGLHESSGNLLFWIVGDGLMQLWATDLNGGTGRVVADLSSDSLGWGTGWATVHGPSVWFSRNGLERAELWRTVSTGTCVGR